MKKISATSNSLKNFIPDYEYWFKKKNITEEEAIFVVNGISPEYAKRQKTPEESNPQYDAHLKNVSKKNGFFSFDYVIKAIKEENVWGGSLYSFCSELYERTYHLPDCLLVFLESKNKKPSHFDHYKNKEQYFADYDKWLDEANLTKITKEQALWLFIGLEPHFVEKYRSIIAKLSHDEIESKKRVALHYAQGLEVESTKLKNWRNEDRFFYGVYVWTISIYDIHEAERILVQNFDYSAGNFFSFVENLYNAGYVPCNELLKYLGKKNKELEYSGRIYEFYKSYSRKPRWTIEELRCLMCGIHPQSKKQIIVFFNSELGNQVLIGKTSLGDNKYFIHLKDETLEGADCLDFDLENYLSGYEIKNENGYEVARLLEIIIENTKVIPPQILIDLIFDKKCKSDSYAKICRTYSEQKHCTAKELISLLLGKHPTESDAIFDEEDIKENNNQLLDSEETRNNSDNYQYNKERGRHEIWDNNGCSYSVESFLDKYISKRGEGYLLQDAIECFEKYTPFLTPKVLKELVFSKKKMSKNLIVLAENKPENQFRAQPLKAITPQKNLNSSIQISYQSLSNKLIVSNLEGLKEEGKIQEIHSHIMEEVFNSNYSNYKADPKRDAIQRYFDGFIKKNFKSRVKKKFGKEINLEKFFDISEAYLIKLKTKMIQY